MNSSLTFRPDLQVHVLSKDKVILFSDTSHFILQNEVYVEIANELTKGPKSNFDLIAKLSHIFTSEFVRKAIQTLATKGFLIDAKPSKLSQNAMAFWYENGISAELLETRLRNINISVRFFTEFSNKLKYKFTSAFEELGFSIADKGEFTVVVLDNYLEPQLANFVDTSQNQNTSWLPLKLRGSKVWLGPIFGNAKNNCWFCLQQSLKENRRVEVDIFGYNGNNLGFPSNCCIFRRIRWSIPILFDSLFHNLSIIHSKNFSLLYLFLSFKILLLLAEG